MYEPGTCYQGIWYDMTVNQNKTAWISISERFTAKHLREHTPAAQHMGRCLLQGCGSIIRYINSQANNVLHIWISGSIRRFSYDMIRDDTWILITACSRSHRAVASRRTKLRLRRSRERRASRPRCIAWMRAAASSSPSIGTTSCCGGAAKSEAEDEAEGERRSRFAEP